MTPPEEREGWLFKLSTNEKKILKRWFILRYNFSVNLSLNTQSTHFHKAVNCALSLIHTCIHSFIHYEIHSFTYSFMFGFFSGETLAYYREKKNKVNNPFLSFSTNKYIFISIISLTFFMFSLSQTILHLTL